MTALHETGSAAYARGRIANKGCLAPFSLTGCLGSSQAMSGLSSDRFVPNQNPLQPFDARQSFPLTVETLRNDSDFVTRLRSGGATYDFAPRCVGNLVVGDDQWGNHWTLAFSLVADPVIH